MAVVRINSHLESEVTGHLSEHGPLERVLGEEAERIARRARQIARGEFYATGGYARGIKAESGLDEHGQLVGRVVATKYTSHWAEFGTSRMRAHHILARAAQQVGFRVLAGQTLGLVGAIGGGAARRAIGGTSGRRAIGGRRRAITGR